MAACVFALKTSKVIDWSAIRKAIGVAGGDVERIENAQPILKIRHRRGQGSDGLGGQIPEGATQAMAPHLLPQVKMQRFESLSHRLMGGKAGPFVMPRLGAHTGQIQIGHRLMQPVGGTVHDAILGRAAILFAVLLDESVTTHPRSASELGC